jgi:hypothetical protein
MTTGGHAEAQMGGNKSRRKATVVIAASTNMRVLVIVLVMGEV